MSDSVESSLTVTLDVTDIEAIRAAAQARGETLRSRLIRAINLLHEQEGLPALQSELYRLPGRRRSAGRAS